MFFCSVLQDIVIQNYIKIHQIFIDFQNYTLQISQISYKIYYNYKFIRSIKYFKYNISHRLISYKHFTNNNNRAYCSGSCASNTTIRFQSKLLIRRSNFGSFWNLEDVFISILRFNRFQCCYISRAANVEADSLQNLFFLCLFQTFEVI